MYKRTLIFINLISLSLFFSCSNTKKATTIPKEYKLVWADEFDGNDINKDNWSFVIWDAGKVNNEWQKYVESSENYKVELLTFSIKSILFLSSMLSSTAHH